MLKATYSARTGRNSILQAEATFADWRKIPYLLPIAMGPEHAQRCNMPPGFVIMGELVYTDGEPEPDPHSPMWRDWRSAEIIADSAIHTMQVA